MQALIDFDGWRKWKGLAAQEGANKASKKGESKTMFSQPIKTRKEKEKEKETAQVGGPVGGAPAAGRPKSPTNVRKAVVGRTNTAEVNGNGDGGRSDSSTSGSTVVPEKR